MPFHTKLEADYNETFNQALDYAVKKISSPEQSKLYIGLLQKLLVEKSDLELEEIEDQNVKEYVESIKDFYDPAMYLSIDTVMASTPTIITAHGKKSTVELPNFSSEKGVLDETWDKLSREQKFELAKKEYIRLLEKAINLKIANLTKLSEEEIKKNQENQANEKEKLEKFTEVTKGKKPPKRGDGRHVDEYGSFYNIPNPPEFLIRLYRVHEFFNDIPSRIAHATRRYPLALPLIATGMSIAVVSLPALMSAAVIFLVEQTILIKREIVSGFRDIWSGFKRLASRNDADRQTESTRLINTLGPTHSHEQQVPSEQISVQNYGAVTSMSSKLLGREERGGQVILTLEEPQSRNSFNSQ